MKIDEMGIGTTRLQNINEQFPAQDILIQSGQLVQYGSGIYGYNNVPLKLKQIIENIIREELERSGCIEVSLPTLQPTSLWKESGRYAKYTESETMLVVKGEEFCLAPTGEEAVVAFAKTKLKSYKDLPVILYQIGEKYRNELRSRGYLLRGRSFTMMDAYSFDKTEQGLVKAYDNVREAYLRIFKRLGFEVTPVAADNGDFGGKKSEEFMLISEAGEDTILFDESTGKAFNKELLDREDYAEYLESEYGIKDISAVKAKKAIELGHIFQLGTKYSEAMDATISDENSNEVPYQMGCYGIGVSRTIAALYEQNILNDKKENPAGIVLPSNIAPYILQIISKGDNEVKNSEAQELYKNLESLNVKSILDDRKGQNIGSKIKDAKVLGTPYLAILGEKTEQGKVEVENSRTGKKAIISQEELVNALEIFEKERIGNTEKSLENYIQFD